MFLIALGQIIPVTAAALMTQTIALIVVVSTVPTHYTDKLLTRLNWVWLALFTLSFLGTGVLYALQGLINPEIAIGAISNGSINHLWMFNAIVALVTWLTRLVVTGLHKHENATEAAADSDKLVKEADNSDTLLAPPEEEE